MMHRMRGLGVYLEVLRLGARSECKWAAAGQIFPTLPWHCDTALWRKHCGISTPVCTTKMTRVQIKATRQLLKTFYVDVAVDRMEANLPFPHTNTFTNELVCLPAN